MNSFAFLPARGRASHLLQRIRQLLAGTFALLAAVAWSQDRHTVVDLAGRTVQMQAPDYPSLEDGREYVLFLRPEPGRSVTGVVGGNQGAFVVDDGHVEQVAGEIRESRGKLSLAAFKEEILQLAAAK